MISFAIIVFREILEIALILGILLAATRNLVGREKWIVCGIVGGVALSVLVAIFAQQISNAMEGMGQEVFNGVVLLASAVLIAGAVIWMKQHAASLSKELKEVGQSIMMGKRPLYTLATVMALAVLRDGSEVVMLTYGSLSSGIDKASILGGAVIGIIFGSLVGFGICYGLLNFATRYIFNFTNWMLILLAAGMVSQAVGFLSSAGYVPELISPIWDTSWIVSNESFLGKMLHTLTGYTARPSGIQMICYVLTIVSIALILKSYANLKKIIEGIKRFTVFTVLLVGLVFVQSDAHATKKVYSPYVEKGELEVETRGSINFDDRSDRDGEQKQKYGFGYGVTNRWFTEFYGEIEKEYNDQGDDLDFSFTEVEWENKFQLTEKGQFPIDLGFLVEYAVSTEDKHADKMEWALLLAKEIGKTEHYANLKMEHSVGGGMTNETEGGVSWSSRYRLKESIEPGFEYHADFGDLGEWSSFHEQTHQLGPVVYGKLGSMIKYDIGYLFGISDEAPEGMLKWMLEFEHHF